MKHLVARFQFSVAKNVGVPAHEFVANSAGDIFERKPFAFGRQLRVEDNLEQDIAQFLRHMREVCAVDGVEQFAAFLDQMGAKRFMGLLPVPRTTARRAQTRHDFAQSLDFTHNGIHDDEQADWPRVSGRTAFFPPILSGHRLCTRAMDKLNEIMAWKRREIAPRLRDVPVSELESCAVMVRRRPSFRAALGDGNLLAVIAEMKRRSPSAGVIAENTAAVEQATAYAAAGVGAISVLTDERYFGGSLEDLESVTGHFEKNSVRVPCLRKDFMVHPLQVIEAARAGASAILIIVRALTDEEIGTLAGAARMAALDVLFEVHDEPEIDRAMAAGATIIGVNNRDLATFTTDLAISERLIPRIPPGVTTISESGIVSPADARRVRAAGASAILVGEALMRAADPAELVAEFRRA